MSSVTQRNPIRLFVSHVWHPDDDYHRVFEYLESASNFFYRNTSTPENRPKGDREALREDLRKQINDAEVVILISSLYRRNIDWIEFQLHCAKAFDKPVVVLEPFGAHDTIPPDMALLQAMASASLSNLILFLPFALLMVFIIRQSGHAERRVIRQELADEVVPWDQRQLVDAIKRQARHEETTRFDVIEFKLD